MNSTNEFNEIAGEEIMEEQPSSSITAEIVADLDHQQADTNAAETTVESVVDTSRMGVDNANVVEDVITNDSEGTPQPEKAQHHPSDDEYITSIEKMTREELLSLPPFIRILNMKHDKKYRGLQSLGDKFTSGNLSKKIFKALLREAENSIKNPAEVQSVNKVKIEGVQELDTGKFLVNDCGISLEGKVITTSPLIIKCIVRNVSSNDYKVVIAHLLEDEWNELTIPMKFILSANLLVNLANKGIDVSSENSHDLTTYFRTVLRLNKRKIKVVRTSNAFGWNSDCNEFYGIIGNTLVDDNGCDGSLAKHVNCKGDETIFLTHYQEKLANNLPLRVVVASSLASALLKPLNILPFFFNLYGTSGVGKTLALMHAAAVWGNPAPGALLKSLNGTLNSLLHLASTAKNLPLMLDELEVIRNYAGYRKLVMTMSTGVERSRLKADSTQAVQGTWQNVFIVNGESSMLRDSDEAGVANRLVEFEVSRENPAIQELDNGAKIAQFLKNNYGFLGKQFLTAVISAIKSGELFEIYNRKLAEIMAKYETTTKIGANIAVILTADFILYRDVFHETPLSVEDVEPLVTSWDKISPSVPAMKFILNFINSNKANFDIKDDIEPVNTRKPIGKCIGKIHIKADKTVKVAIMKNTLSDALASKAYSFDSVKNEWANQGFLIKNGKHFDKFSYVNGLRCYVVNLQFSMPEEEEK